MVSELKIAVIGLDDAGGQIAAGLQRQGATVLGYHSAKIKFPPVPTASSLQEAVATADIVFNLSSATLAIKMAQEVVPFLKSSAVYCDLNTATPALKKRLESLVLPHAFVDVAVMGDATQDGEKAPLVISGSGAKQLGALLAQFELNLTYVSDVAGDAAARKLLKLVLDKGMAAVAIDFMWAAKELGLADWAYAELTAEYESSNAKTAKNLLSSTQANPKLGSVELADVNEMLSAAGYESTMVHGIEATLSQIVHSKRVPFAGQAD